MQRSFSDDGVDGIAARRHGGPQLASTAALCIVILTGLLRSTFPSLAAQQLPACRISSARADQPLAAALHAAFSTAAPRSGVPCALAWRLLSYPDAKVLLTLGKKPGQSCEGCAAVISATVLSQGRNGLERASPTLPMASLGQQGRPGRVVAVALGRDDGAVFETPYQQQGYRSTLLELYAFRAGQVVALVPPGRIILSADDTGTLDGHPIIVTGSWHVDPGAAPVLRVAYAVRAGDHVSRTEASWRIVGKRLVPLAGGVPSEAVAASGG